MQYNKLSRKVAAIKPSPTLSIAAKAAALNAVGENIISLSTGEPDFDTPETVKEAAQKATKDGKTKYTPVSGIQPLKDAIIDKFRRDNGLLYERDQIIVSNGAKHVIFNALFAMLNPGEEVVIPSPFWTSYPDMVRLCDGVPVFVDCSIEDGFKLKPEALNNAITPKTKCVMLNFPNNPTGVAYTAAELKEILNVLRLQPHVYIISDDIYENIVFDDFEFRSLGQVEPRLYDRIVTVNGVSKSHAMTGWRIGYCGGPRDLVRAMDILQSHSTSNPSSIGQYAALEALTGDYDAWKSANQRLFQERRDIVVSKFRKLPAVRFVIPQGAFYLFLECSALMGSKTKDQRVISNGDVLCEYLLEKAGVAVVPGSAFGAPNCFRLSYAINKERLINGCDAIIQAIEKLAF